MCQNQRGRADHALWLARAMSYNKSKLRSLCPAGSHALLQSRAPTPYRSATNISLRR